MKKDIVVVLLGLVWCTNVFALSQQSAIDQYLSGRKLDSVEGIWGNNYGNINVITKMGGSYSLIVYNTTLREMEKMLAHCKKVMKIIIMEQLKAIMAVDHLTHVHFH
mgnify:CR=1 FL=1